MSDVPPPGWYHAEGDPPDTHRYWDGSTWQGGPQPVAANPTATQPQTGAPTPAGGFAPVGAGPIPMGGYLESSQATMSLVLAILGLVCCGVLSPISWAVAQKEITAIDTGRRDPTNRGVAVAGKVIGIIGTLLWVIAIVASVFLFWVAGSSTSMGS